LSWAPIEEEGTERGVEVGEDEEEIADVVAAVG